MNEREQKSFLTRRAALQAGAAVAAGTYFAGKAPAAEAAALKPYRLHIVPRGSGSAAQYAQRLPYGDHRMARLLALNGVDNAAEFTQRSEIKLVEP